MLMMKMERGDNGGTFSQKDDSTEKANERMR